ncbi:MAG: YbhN family protein [Anaerolineales bacterium]
MNSARQSRRISLIKWVGTLLSAILLIILLSQQNWQSVGQALSQIPFWRFVIAFLLMVISRFAVASRWYALLHATCDDLSWGQSVKVTFAGLFATNFLPSTIGGDIVRLAGAVRSGVDAAIATASLVMDRLVGMFGMVLALPFGILPLYYWFSSNPTIFGLSSNGGTLMLSFPIVKNIWRKVLSFSQKTFQSIKLWLGKPASLVQSLLFTGIHMACFFGIFWILLAGLNDPIPFSLAAGLYSFVYLVTLLPISINGYGLQELSISVIFSEVGGITLQNSLTLALIFRTMTMLASLPGAFFLSGLFSRNQDDVTPRA